MTKELSKHFFFFIETVVVAVNIATCLLLSRPFSNLKHWTYSILSYGIYRSLFCDNSVVQKGYHLMINTQRFHSRERLSNLVHFEAFVVDS